ncbi:MAG: tetratricopeptide repeat protein, partial [Kiloniellales bacterium]
RWSPEEAIPLIKKAMRLSPYYPPWYPSMLALGYLQTGRLEEMIRVGEEEVQREAGSMTMRAHERLVFAYTELGRHDQAKVHVAKVLELTPDYSLASREALTLQKYKDQVFWKKFFNVLRKTGLPD